MAVIFKYICINKVYDKEMDRKYQSCRLMLSDIYQVFKKIKR